MVLVARAGIEPTPSDRKTDVLTTRPKDHWCADVELHHNSKSANPIFANLEHLGASREIGVSRKCSYMRDTYMAGPLGLEPRTSWLTARRSAN